MPPRAADGSPPSASAGEGARVYLVSLQRTAERRAAAEAHLSAVLGGAGAFATFDAVDGARWAGEARAGGAPAFEAACGARVYRGWPVQEASDARRVLAGVAHAGPAEGADRDERTDAEAWMAYERLFRVWHSERARDYVDSHCRRLTVGDVGCTLSHVGVWERALREGARVACVFEDDARPRAGALEYALREGERARAAGVDWHVLYIHSSKYDRVAEASVELPGAEESPLVYAAHRKLTDAYLITAEGCRHALAADLRSTGVLPIDDFLPALYGRGHPRPDVMAHEGVRAARASAGEGGFVALAVGGDAGGPGAGGWFGRDGRDGASAGDVRARQLSVNLAHTSLGRSQSNRAQIIIGDYGPEQEGADADQLGADADAPPGVRGVRGAPADARARVVGLCAPVDAGDVSECARRLRERSWVLVRLADAAQRDALLRAQRAWEDFFTRAGDAYKRTLKPTTRRHGDLRLWGCGHTSQRAREQFHAVAGAFDAMPWPDSGAYSAGGGADAGASARERVGAEVARAEACARAGCAGGVEALSRAACGVLGEFARRLLAAVDPALEEERIAAASAGGDTSAFDVFRYYGNAACAGDEGRGGGGGGDDDGSAGALGVPSSAQLDMGAHTDPGYLTLKPVSDTPGLEVYDALERCWVGPEALSCAAHAGASSADVLVLACDCLRGARSCPHRVRAAAAPRLSLVYELRGSGC